MQCLMRLSDLEEDIDQLVNDSDTEFVADEDLPECPPQSSNNNVLTPEANVHILSRLATSLTYFITCVMGLKLAGGKVL